MKYWYIVLLLVLITMIFVVKKNVRLPEVHKSVSTGKMILYCPERPKGVEVTQNDLPDKYINIWIK